MRKEFDPYHDCLQSAQGVISPAPEQGAANLWIPEAVQLIVQLTYVYDTLRNNSSSPDRLLTEIGLRLEKIDQTFQEVNRKLEKVIELLYDLPTVIRGEVESVVLRATLGRAQERAGIVQDLINDRILSNEKRLTDSLDMLRELVGGAMSVGGATAILVVSPVIAVWLSGAAALEKAKQKAGREIDSPWKTTFMKGKYQIFEKLFKNTEATDYEFDKNVIPRFPPHMTPLILKEGKLVLPGPFTEGTYRVSCPFGLKPEKIQVRQGLPADWVDIQPNSVQHKEANAAYETFVKKRKEVIAFYRLLPQLFEKKPLLLNAFNEPLGFFDTIVS